MASLDRDLPFIASPLPILSRRMRAARAERNQGGGNAERDAELLVIGWSSLFETVEATFCFHPTRQAGRLYPRSARFPPLVTNSERHFAAQ
jgi:hypothetical protein